MSLAKKSKNEKPGTVRVTVQGFRNQEGNALVSLFDSARGFPDRGKLARKRIESQIDDDTVEMILSDVAPGTYAVAVLHDEDKDYKMKKGAFGIPKEGYGVSNNVRGRFGPPKFKQATFKVTSGAQVSLTIQLIYH